jgi:hypothetical protein
VWADCVDHGAFSVIRVYAEFFKPLNYYFQHADPPEKREGRGKREVYSLGSLRAFSSVSTMRE